MTCGRVLIGALGCNLAWGVIDAVMYLMGTWGERLARRLLLFRRPVHRVVPMPGVRSSRITSRRLILPASDDDGSRVTFRLHPCTPSADCLQPVVEKRDLLGALGVFLLVFSCPCFRSPCRFLSLRGCRCSPSGSRTSSPSVFYFLDGVHVRSPRRTAVARRLADGGHRHRARCGSLSPSAGEASKSEGRISKGRSILCAAPELPGFGVRLRRRPEGWITCGSGLRPFDTLRTGCTLPLHERSGKIVHISSQLISHSATTACRRP